MSTSDTLDPVTPARHPAGRKLRRSHTGRVGAGVAAGLGEYFGLDPVLFRVLFATSAFFGGAGIIAYLIAWAAIPEEGTEHAPIDGWAAALRGKRVPLWAVVFGGGVLLWLVAFSWWAPGPFVPILAFVVLAVFLATRRQRQQPPSDDAPLSDPAPAAAIGAVDLTKHDAAAAATDEPSWSREAGAWLAESRAASRVRRRRAQPIRVTVLVVLVLTLAALGVVDAATGIALQLYFWAGLGILGLGLLVGLAVRRLPVSFIVLIIPFAIGAIAFGGSSASLHDGVGQRTWAPTGTAADEYRLAIGQGVLDLRSATQLPSRIDVTMGAGQIRVILPETANASVAAHIRFGELDVDGTSKVADGVGVDRVVEAPKGASGKPVRIVVHVADGNISVDRR